MIFKAGLHVDAVDPEVDVALGGQVAIEPARVLSWRSFWIMRERSNCGSLRYCRQLAQY